MEGSGCGPVEVLSRHLSLVSEENHEETRSEYLMSGRFFERRTQTRSGFSVNVLGEGVRNHLAFGREPEVSAWMDETEEKKGIMPSSGM